MTRIANASETLSFYISLVPSDEKKIPLPNDRSIPPKTGLTINIDQGTMALYVWTNPDSNPIWSGVVPTKIKNPLVIYPDRRIVTYDDRPIPNTGYRNHFYSTNGYVKWIGLLFIILIICIGIWYLYRKT